MTSELGRLSLQTLGSAAARSGVLSPAFAPEELDIGIVHLGVGAFHRAHQAVYTEDAAVLAEENRWGILGVTGRSRRVVDQLGPQDGLYSVLTSSASGESLRILGSLRDVAAPPTDAEKILAGIAAQGTHIVSLTITEKGYPQNSAGALDTTNADVMRDVAQLRRELATGQHQGAAQTILGLLVRGLAQRFRIGGQPISVLPCDNLPSNGVIAGSLVRGFAESAGHSGFTQWLHDAVTFPCTMVDRIVPASTDADKARVRTILGLRDEGLVVAEPFGQWVIEDAFAADRPAWERAGATITQNVEPYEVAKLRMLNATHSLLAYLGALRGYATIADAVADPELLGLARALQRQDVVPTLQAPPELDLAEYGESILTRFANPALGHTTIQVAMDGSQKLPIRVLGTVSDRLNAGTVPELAALVVAAWMVFIYRGHDVNGRELPLDDPLAAQLESTAAGSESGLATRLFDMTQIFPADVAGHSGFRTAVERYVKSLLTEVS